MLTQADRAAERRRAKLEDVQRQVEEGSLKIRRMTAEERQRYPTVAAKTPGKVAGRAPRTTVAKASHKTAAKTTRTAVAKASHKTAAKTTRTAVAKASHKTAAKTARTVVGKTPRKRGSVKERP